MGFRLIQATDLTAILHIEKQAYSHPWSTQIFKDCLQQKRNQCWLFEQQTIQAYGVISLIVSQGQVIEAEILNLTVAPQQQRQGLGHTMLKHLLKQSQSAETVYLEVRASNQVAINLYHRCGFHTIGTRPNYYPKNKQQREDALILALTQFVF